MKTWQTPKAVEIPAGMEIGAYAPAEMDGPPHVASVAGEANLTRTHASVGPDVAPAATVAG